MGHSTGAYETFFAGEVFQSHEPYSRDRVRVLLSIDATKTGVSPQLGVLPQRRQDLDFPISWIRRQGQRRKFYTALGPNPDTFWNAPVLAHLPAGIQIALGDLEADATPRRQRRSHP